MKLSPGARVFKNRLFRYRNRIYAFVYRLVFPEKWPTCPECHAKHDLTLGWILLDREYRDKAYCHECGPHGPYYEYNKSVIKDMGSQIFSIRNGHRAARKDTERDRKAFHEQMDKIIDEEGAAK